MSDTIIKLSPKEKEFLQGLRGDLERLPAPWLACRDFRHAWETLRDFYVDRDKGAPEIRRDLTCLRCATVRRETYENNKYGLDRLAASYQYPADYGLHGVPKQLNLQALVRQESYRRSMERIAEESKS